jgi:hypothetical protein
LTSRAGERGSIAAQRGPLSGRGGETTRDGALRYNFEVFSSPARKPFRGSAGHKPCAAQIPCGVPAARVDRPFFGAPARASRVDSSFVFACSRTVAWVSPGRHLGNHMAETPPTEYFIQGVTKDGKKFRPSDWSERLAGVMSCFGPGASGPNARLQYSLYVRPTLLGDTKCVILDSRLRDVEPMAFDFVMNFAKDNNLVVTEACELPDYNEKK